MNIGEAGDGDDDDDENNNDNEIDVCVCVCSSPLVMIECKETLFNYRVRK